MLWLGYVILIFAVTIQFSCRRIKPSLRTKIELCEMKYNHILIDVLKINKNIENIWETLNFSRIGQANTPEIVSKETLGNIGTISIQSSETYVRDLINRINRNEKSLRDEKHVCRKRWSNLETKYEKEVCKYDDISSLIDRKQANILKKVDKLRTEITSLRTAFTESASNVTHELIETNEKQDKEIGLLRNKNVKLNEVIANTKSETDALSNKLNELESFRKSARVSLLSLKQNGWIQHDNSFYKVFDEKLSWFDAMFRCKSESNGIGFLAETQNINEVYVVKDLLPYPQHVWLGGCDIETEGSWKWCGSGRAMTFQHWRKTEPNNHAVLCVVLTFAGFVLGCLITCLILVLIPVTHRKLRSAVVIVKQTCFGTFETDVVPRDNKTRVSQGYTEIDEKTVIQFSKTNPEIVTVNANQSGYEPHVTKSKQHKYSDLQTPDGKRKVVPTDNTYEDMDPTRIYSILEPGSDKRLPVKMVTDKNCSLKTDPNQIYFVLEPGSNKVKPYIQRPAESKSLDRSSGHTYFVLEISKDAPETEAYAISDIKHDYFILKSEK